jgi:hypothetical protein
MPADIVITVSSVLRKFLFIIRRFRSRVAQSVQCLTTGWTTGRWRFDARQRRGIFPLASVSRPALGPTQPPVQWVLGFLSLGVKRGRGVTLTTYLHLVPRSWMSRSCTSCSPLCFHRCVVGLLYLCMTFSFCTYSCSKDVRFPVPWLHTLALWSRSSSK